MARIPSRQLIRHGPVMARRLFTSSTTPRCVPGTGLVDTCGVLPVSSPKYAHHSCADTASSPPQLTIVAGTDAAPSKASYNAAVQRAMPAVVNISTSKEVHSQRHPLLNDPIFRRFFGDQLPDEAQRASSLGSGVLVSTSGYVLTNHHVVEAADEIEIALADGRKLLAKVVGSDPDTDLAVLRVTADNLPAITFGSSESLQMLLRFVKKFGQKAEPQPAVVGASLPRWTSVPPSSENVSRSWQYSS